MIFILFLFILVDLNVPIQQESGEGIILQTPIISLLYSLLIYVLVFLLLHTNKIYVLFISVLVVSLIILDKIKKTSEITIKDQELLQERLYFIFRLNNIFVIIIVLTIIIGTLSTLNVKELYRTVTTMKKTC